MLETEDLNLLTIADVKESTRSSEATIYREIRAGRLEAVKVGRSTRFKPQAVRNWIARLPSKNPPVITAGALLQAAA